MFVMWTSVNYNDFSHRGKSYLEDIHFNGTERICLLYLPLTYHVCPFFRKMSEQESVIIRAFSAPSCRFRCSFKHWTVETREPTFHILVYIDFDLRKNIPPKISKSPQWLQDAWFLTPAQDATSVGVFPIRRKQYYNKKKKTTIKITQKKKTVKLN